MSKTYAKADGPCCESATDDDVDCNPSTYTSQWSTGNCDTYLQNYCSIGSNLFTSNVCQTWMENPSGDSDVVLAQKCADPLYTNQNGCACYNAAQAILNGVQSTSIRPECISKVCTANSTSYRTRNMIRPCPSITDCSINLSGTSFASDSSAFTPEFNQKCGSSSTDADTTTSTTNDNTSNSTTTDTTATSSNIAMYVVIGIIVLLIIIAIIYFIYAKKS
jgi:cobalamin biosynthesis Mg chelatase CobN